MTHIIIIYFYILNGFSICTTFAEEEIHSVIHLTTRCEDMLCFDAKNTMTEFYAINVLWSLDHTALAISKGLDI